MATVPDAATRTSWLDGLADPRLAIASPRIDALCFWLLPLISLVFVQTWFGIAARLPASAANPMAGVVVMFSAVLTYAHLIAVVPRAYLNRAVFKDHRLRLTLAPPLLVAVFLISPLMLAIGGAAAILWDVHHSAMQNFGLARIYDMKAGNDARLLRRADLRLAWMLYVGPLAAGASLMLHVHALDRLGPVGLTEIAKLPGVLEGGLSAISMIAVLAWVATIAWAVRDYLIAAAQGYRIPAHKAALIGSTGLVSLIAWGFCAPIVALVAINIYHAIQYFALVWLKEGARMSEGLSITPRGAFLVFGGGCAIVGVAYQATVMSNMAWLLAPFIACSLLHFWYDSFVWSVRKKQV